MFATFLEQPCKLIAPLVLILCNNYKRANLPGHNM